MLNWASRAHADGPTGGFGGAPSGATKRCTVVADACGHPRWGLGCSSLWGRETLHWVGEHACGRLHWGRRWSSLWGHEA
eukprot:3941824-Pyramimonas_sp.AAC.1